MENAVLTPSEVSPQYTTMLKRAALAALVIGIVLNLVNQGPRVAAGIGIAPLQFTMVFITPFLVVMVSQLFAFQHAIRDAGQTANTNWLNETWIRTALGNEILTRSAVIALTMASMNATLIAGKNLVTTGQLTPLPAALLAQALFLPLIFSALSQSLTYRRVLRDIHVQSSP